MKKVISVILACVMAFSALGCIALAADSYTKVYSVILESGSESRVEFVHIDPAYLEGKIAGNPEDYATELYVTEKDGAGSAELSAYNRVVIALRGKGSYAPDQTTAVKIYPKTMDTDIITGVEYGDRLPTALIATLGEDGYEKQNYATPLIVVGNKSNTLAGNHESIPADFSVLRDTDGDPINEYGEKVNKKLKDDGTYRELEFSQYASEIIYTFTFYNVTEDIVVRPCNVEMDSVSGAKSFVMNLIDFFRQLIEWFFGLFGRK